MGFIRIGKEITVALVLQNNALVVGNALGENLHGHPMIDLTHHIAVIFTDDDQDRLFDVLQTLAGIIALAG